MAATSNNVISPRRHDLDNLRSFLTGLVISHHTALAYGAGAQWNKRSALAPPGISLPLLCYSGLNQSYFMAVFFALSGRLSAQSLAKLDRSPGGSRWGFVRNKLLRLGVPTLAVTMLLEPLTVLLGSPSWDAEVLRALWMKYFFTLRGARGSVWFTANLLVFDVLAAALKPTTAPVDSNVALARRRSKIDWGRIALLGGIAVSGVSFFVRLYYRVGTTLPYIGV